MKRTITKESEMVEAKEIKELLHMCIIDTDREAAGKVYVIYPTHVKLDNTRIFKHITETGHLLSEGFKNRHFIEWGD
ncbi:hypothetical protein [Mammaliicoccus lentus]|uniref:hypothetical protein n=1 Tax=Mammaliicoccus lentus TaxID=42858 RepID=UPI003CF9F7D2